MGETREGGGGGGAGGAKPVVGWAAGGRREIPQEWGRARGVPHSAVAAGVGTVLLLVR
jgi:hypothetical protein